MGCGASTAQVPPRQLVLLGGGECGKTTIFKQIQLLHGSGFSDEVRSDWVSAVCSSPLRSMRAMLTKADELGLEIDSVSATATTDVHAQARAWHRPVVVSGSGLAAVQSGRMAECGRKKGSPGHRG